MEQLIAIQKRQEAAEKAAKQKADTQQQQSGKEIDQNRVGAPPESGGEKGKEKGITIKEGASQAKKTTAPKAAPCPREMEKRGWGSLLRFLLPLGNGLILEMQLPWFLSPWERFQTLGW